MGAKLKKGAVLVFLLIVISVSGCFLTVTQNLKNGSAMLKSSYQSLNNDYEELVAAAELVVKDNTEENIKNYRIMSLKFDDGFDAVGLAIAAMDDAIQALRTEDEKGSD